MFYFWVQSAVPGRLVALSRVSRSGVDRAAAGGRAPRRGSRVTPDRDGAPPWPSLKTSRPAAIEWDRSERERGVSFRADCEARITVGSKQFFEGPISFDRYLFRSCNRCAVKEGKHANRKRCCVLPVGTPSCVTGRPGACPPGPSRPTRAFGALPCARRSVRSGGPYADKSSGGEPGDVPNGSSPELPSVRTRSFRTRRNPAPERKRLSIEARRFASVIWARGIHRG